MLNSLPLEQYGAQISSIGDRRWHSGVLDVWGDEFEILQCAAEVRGFRERSIGAYKYLRFLLFHCHTLYARSLTSPVVIACSVLSLVPSIFCIMGFRAAAIIVAALVPMIHGQTSATNVSTIPVPPTCIQPREAVDPSGADISLALTGAVASACDPSQQKTTTDGTSSTIYFTTGSYSFNISGPSHEVNQRVVPASFCPDTFNAIINTCINAPDGNSWGGWSAGGGANYSISNLIYPVNGLVAASPFSATASSAEASSGAIVPSAISDIPPSSTGTLSADSTVPTTVSQPASPSAPLPGPTPGPQTGSSSASLETARTNVSGSSVIEIGASNVLSSAGPAPSGTAVVIPGQNGAPACAYYL